MLKLVTLLLIWTVPSLAISAEAKQYCPGKVATIEGSNLSLDVATILKQVYAKLGCTLETESLPGRRGVTHFNKSLVEGEITRFRMIEKQYEKPFVRSSVRILNITTVKWSHPSPEISKARPMGYLLGVAWQERYVANSSKESQAKSVNFKSDEEIVAAYNRGTLGSFLATKYTMNTLLKKDSFLLKPVLSETVSSIPAFHYLDAKYTKFMADFSEIIEQQDPLSGLN